jgi:hypothetical protein
MSRDYRRTPDGFIDLDYEVDSLHTEVGFALAGSIGIGTLLVLVFLGFASQPGGLVLTFPQPSLGEGLWIVAVLTLALAGLGALLLRDGGGA